MRVVPGVTLREGEIIKRGGQLSRVYITFVNMI
jgi:hypothetical protein